MTDTRPVFAIEGEFSIYRAAELAQALQSWLGAGHDCAIRVDLGQVSDIDSAGLQVLVSLQHSATAQGIALHLDPVSPAVQEVLTLTRLDHVLLPVPSQ